jgi:hypothetical protein
MSAFDVLRSTTPRKVIGNTFFTANKFNHLTRDASPVPASQQDTGNENRQRLGSLSQKRKNSDTDVVLSYATAASGAQAPDPESNEEEYMLELTKVKSLCEKANVDIGESNADVGVLAILKTINDAVLGLANAATKKKQSAPKSIPSTMVNLGTIPKRPKFVPGNAKNPAPAPKKNPAPARPPSPDAVDPAQQGFRDAVKSAEKSTLIFNLNMGTVPIMNKDTMSKRATLALMSMAAVKEGRTAENPSNESISVVDDVLSVSTGIHFFGPQTQTYRHPRDPKSGSFCTVPVKYDFNDRETRIKAEQMLRTRCDINCSTPYPPILRECIRRTINSAKDLFPDNQVKVLVDATNFKLRIARRASKDAGWTYAKDDIPIPKEALDVRSKKIPESLSVAKVEWGMLPLTGPTPPLSPPPLYYNEAGQPP